MRGVGHQLALRADRVVERRARALQAVEHRVEAGGQLADLIIGVDADPAGEVVGLADVLGRLRDLGQWRQDSPPGKAAECRRQRDSAQEHQREDQPQVGEDPVDAVERARELEGDARSGLALTITVTGTTTGKVISRRWVLPT